MAKNLPAMQETWVQFLGQEDPLEKGKATPSSTLAWRIPWTEECGGLQFMGSQSQSGMTERLTHTCMHAFIYAYTPRHAGYWFPDQGSNLCPLQWKQSPNQWTAREFPSGPFKAWFCPHSLT